MHHASELISSVQPPAVALQVAEMLERPPSWPRPVLDAKALGAELRAVSRELQLGASAAGGALMPTARDLADAGRGDLLRSISQRGGFCAVAAAVGLRSRRHARRSASFSC